MTRRQGSPQGSNFQMAAFCPDFTSSFVPLALRPYYWSNLSNLVFFMTEVEEEELPIMAVEWGLIDNNNES